MSKFDRVIWIVLDGVGAGHLPDASLYGDDGSNTLENMAQAFARLAGRPLELPHLGQLGLGKLSSIPDLKTATPRNCAFGKAMELSQGKDTTSGHWEMAGIVVEKAFKTFPNGFSEEIVNRWVQKCGLPGILGNKPASGTEIIEELGEAHRQSGKPILYTSADSVWQVAAHEGTFGLERLYKICKEARKICDELQIGRVIARPFVGNPQEGIPFKRTYHRKDYSILPPKKSVLDLLRDGAVHTEGVGKISAIFAGQGIDQSTETAGNTDGIKTLLEKIRTVKKGLIFCNLIDFDMLFGHRRDPVGFGKALEEFDRSWPEMAQLLGKNDLVILTADHGNDPTFKGSDHTREHAPILVYSPAIRGAIDLGTRKSFADIGATLYEAFTGSILPANAHLAGESFLGKLTLT